MGVGLLVFLLLPLAALVVSSPPGELLRGLSHPLVGPALWLSLRTSLVSLVLTVATGTPLAWWLARSPSRLARVLETLVAVPIVLPPAVVGLALLQAWGRGGLLGGVLAATVGALPFTTAAVVVAQVVVSAPFFVQAAVGGFRRVDGDTLLVARTLGASPLRTFLVVAAPAALPSLVAGAALAWARAVGEFGATLLFAGNFPGRTQTMPLAIYATLEVDVAAARALSLVLAAAALAVLLVLRVAPAVPAWWRRGTERAA